MQLRLVPDRGLVLPIVLGERAYARTTCDPEDHRMTPTTRFSIGLPTAIDAPLATFARRAEELGFWSAWAVDHAVGEEHAEDPSLDPLHVMTHVAAVTTRLRVGVAVLILPRRNPAQLARDLATMDVLSGGRITVGVGLGGKDPGAAAFGFRTGQRAKHLIESALNNSVFHNAVV